MRKLYVVIQKYILLECLEEWTLHKVSVSLEGKRTFNLVYFSYSLRSYTPYIHTPYTHTHTTLQEIGQQNVVQKGKQTVGKLLNNIAWNHSQNTFIPCLCCASSWKAVVCYAASRAPVRLKPAWCCTRTNLLLQQKCRPAPQTAGSLRS